MAYTLGMNIRQGTKELIDVNLDLKDRHGRLHLIEKARRAVNRLRHEFEHQVQVHFIFLHNKLSATPHQGHSSFHSFTYALSV